MQAYLQSARAYATRGFLFFLPDNSTLAPPEADNNVWSLGDDEHWKRENDFPIYAIPGQNGNVLLHASSRYSGNMTDAPHGHMLTEYYDARDYVRLYAQVNTGNGTTLPSLWVFLLVVLGILLAVIGGTSTIMHYMQRRRRQTLRTRVANGEVDLEALGIKRLTVPQEVLDTMPLYIYGSGEPVQPGSVARETDPTAPAVEAAKAEVDSTSRPSSPSPTTQPTPAIPPLSIRSHHHNPIEQPTCAICLDDFVAATSAEPQGTIVRELPCQHIFHPECVDTFLRDNSSLCPMCKKTALPKGYCPRVVTNAMVRRERMVRRIRPSAGQDEESVTRETLGMTGLGWRRPSEFIGGGGRRAFSVPLSRSTTANAERRSQITNENHAANTSASPMTPPPTLPRSNSIFSRQRAASATTAQGSSVQPPSNAGRREWARQRAINMLGRNRAPVDPDAEEAARTPAWRKALRSLFPGRR